MTYDIPLTPRPLTSPGHFSGPQCRVLTVSVLRAHGVTSAEAAEHCRPGGPWRQLLPGVLLLHPGPPTSEDRLHAVLLYALRSRRVPSQTGRGGRPAAPRPPAGDGGPEAMITGAAALALRGFASSPPLPALDHIDVLVPHTRHLDSAGCARIRQSTTPLPVPEEISGIPVAPAERAVADVVADLDDDDATRRLLTEAVRGGHCNAQAVLRELEDAELLSAPHVAGAVGGLVAEGRSMAEERLYDVVRTQGLPSPCWNVDLRLPGGPYLGGVDAYWPDQAVALSIDARIRADVPGEEPSGLWDAYAQQRESLERLGITVVHLVPRRLRESPEQQAAVVRTALMAAEDRDPAAYVRVLPR